MRLTEKELKLAIDLNLYNIDIEGVIKRAYEDKEYMEVINRKTFDFCFETICLTCETFTHYVPRVVSKRKFYRVELVVDGELIAEFFGKDKDSMNDNFMKLKRHCKG